MKTSRTAFGLLLAATAIAAAPAAAQEAPLVPPENSAVNQYTEAFPTAGGDKDAHDHDGGNRSPKKVLGSDNAKKLREQGPAGQATAELAAETAPSGVETDVEDTVVTTDESDETEAGAGARSGDGGGQSQSQGKESGQTRNTAEVRVVVAEPDGSSGLSEVIARATGTSSTGGMGIFLPLLVLATILWAFAYLARHRRPVG